MIDSPNAGQTCKQCRHYQAVHMVQDRFFGEHPVRDYCAKRKARVEMSDGEACPLFLRRLYRHHYNLIPRPHECEICRFASHGGSVLPITLRTPRTRYNDVLTIIYSAAPYIIQ